MAKAPDPVTPQAPQPQHPSINISAPPLGFASVLTLDLITVDHAEHERILQALANAGYNVHIAAALSGPNGHGVMGGRWTLARDLRPLRSAPQQQQPTPPPVDPPDPPKAAAKKSPRRSSSKKTRSRRKKKR